MARSILFRSAVELAELIRTRQVTSLEVVRAHLAQIRQHDDKTHAVVTLLEPQALAAARLADEAVRAGAPLGPLHGVPMTIKDTYRVAGIRTTTGLPQYRHYRPARDCELVARIRRAGAIFLGRTNVPFAAFDWQCRNPLFAEGLNPWDPSRTPGGSSGGAAAALSAGFTPLELASDIAGSIRYPAHCCGVLGLRTTDGLLPKHDWAAEDLPEAPWNLAVPGPMARTIEDLELLLSVLLDAPASAPPPMKPRLKIAVSSSLCGLMPDGATSRLLAGLSDQLHAAGHEMTSATPFAEVEAADALDGEAAFRVWGMVAGYEYRRLLPRWLQSWPGRSLYAFYLLRLRLGSGPLTRWFGRGLRAEARDYERAMEQRQRIHERADAFFADHDLWILPVSPGEAIRRQRGGRAISVEGRAISYSAYLGSYLCPTAVLGTPALTLPIGVGDSGLPIAVQVHGARGNDLELVRLARHHLSRFVDVRVPPGFGVAAVTVPQTAHG
jgi:amidase